MSLKSLVSQVDQSTARIAELVKAVKSYSYMDQSPTQEVDIRLAGQRDGIEAAGDLFRELGVRCIFATAHDDQRTRSRAEPFAPLGWLAKPYTMASLIASVRQAISGGN